MLSDGNNEFKHMLQNVSLTNVITQPADYTTTKGTCIDLSNAVERVGWEYRCIDRDVFNSTNINDVQKIFTDVYTQHS